MFQNYMVQWVMYISGPKAQLPLQLLVLMRLLTLVMLLLPLLLRHCWGGSDDLVTRSYQSRALSCLTVSSIWTYCTITLSV